MGSKVLRRQALVTENDQQWFSYLLFCFCKKKILTKSVWEKIGLFWHIILWCNPLGMKVIMWGAWDSWSHCICTKNAEEDESMCSVFFHHVLLSRIQILWRMLPTLGFSSHINLLSEDITHSNAQRPYLKWRFFSISPSPTWLFSCSSLWDNQHKLNINCNYLANGIGILLTSLYN